ncbi:hypothetical protein PIROE2DRAFT_30135, partial [Piromyces sp. E2]
SSYNNIKLESMDSFNEMDKFQKGRYTIVRDGNNERPTVQLVLDNNGDNYTAVTDSLMNNYASYTLVSTQSKNTGRPSDPRRHTTNSSSSSPHNNNNNINSPSVKNIPTKPVVIKQEYNSNN